MCVFAGDVDVENTRIAVCRCNNSWQFTMYQNALSNSPAANAMILAVPCKAEDLVLHDMSHVQDPWDALEPIASPSFGRKGSGRDEYDLAEFAAQDELLLRGSGPGGQERRG